MNSLLQNKLLHYEAHPPKGVWDKIATSLNEDISVTVSEKLYEFEEQPSPAVWQKIDARLDIVVIQKAKVVPFFTRYRRPLKYSGAVAIFIFIAVLTSLLISKKTESEVSGQNVVNNTPAVKEDTLKPNISSEKKTAVAQKLEKSYSEPLIAKSKVSKSRPTQNQSSFFAESFLPRQAERNEMVSSSIPADKYMIYSDGDGNAIRLPKKIFSAFVCPTDNFDCKQRLQRLREKFAASATTADFNGLLEILKSLQENQ
jgi:hypothetical protein